MIVEQEHIKEIVDNPKALLFAQKLFLSDIELLSVRSRNVLRSLGYPISNSKDFFQRLLSLDGIKLSKIRNCGQKSSNEIILFLNTFSRKLLTSGVFTIGKNIEDTGGLAEENRSNHRDLPIYIENIRPIIFHNNGNLSVRSNNALNNLIESCHHSVQSFYNLITSPDFSVVTLRNVGKGTAEELSMAINEIKEKIEYYSSADEKTIEEDLYVSALENLYSNKVVVKELLSFKRDNGYFPYFKAIQEYLNQCPNQDVIIINNGIRINYDSRLDLPKIASQIEYSYERIRQIRDNYFNELTNFFNSLSELNPNDTCHYSCLMNDLHREVLSSESVDFCIDFIHWVIGSIFKEYSFIGNPHTTLTSSFSTRGFLALVPSKLVALFDFDGFIQNLNSVVKEKRTDEQSIPLNDLISPYIKQKYIEDYDDIETACRSIIYLHFKLDIDYGKVIFKANKQKTLPYLIHDIIKEKGEPMSLDQIIEEFIFLYPERSVNTASFRSSILHHPDIISVGKSGNYSLKAWNKDYLREGTIRDFVCEFLDSRDVSLATPEEIVEYVQRFRPQSTARSIISNIFQDRDHKFSKFTKVGANGIKYIGYTNKQYESSVLKKTSITNNSKELNMTRRELYDLLWQKPITQLAKDLNIKYYTLKKICLNMNIPVPGSSYWSSLRYGKIITKPKLPPYFGDDKVTIDKAVSTTKSESIDQGILNDDNVVIATNIQNGMELRFLSIFYSAYSFRSSIESILAAIESESTFKGMKWKWLNKHHMPFLRMLNNMSRIELYELLWNKPLNQVAGDIGIRYDTLKTICKNLDIPVPNNYYWLQLQEGKHMPRRKLPSFEGDESISIEKAQGLTDSIVIARNDQFETAIRFLSIRDAAYTFNSSLESIMSAINRGAIHKGMKWQFTEERDSPNKEEVPSIVQSTKEPTCQEIIDKFTQALEELKSAFTMAINKLNNE